MVKEISTFQDKAGKVKAEAYNLLQQGELTAAQRSLAERAFNEYDQLLQTFVSGGRISGYDLAVNPAKGTEMNILSDLEQVWIDLHQDLTTALNAPARIDTVVQRVEQVRISDTLDIYTSRVVSDIQSIPNPAVERSFNNISSIYLPEWLQLNDRYSNYLIQESKSDQELVFYIILIFWVLIIIGLVIILAGIKNKVFNPLNEIIHSGNKISQGTYNVQVKNYDEKEINDLSKILNHTAATFQATASYIKALGEGKLDGELKLAGDEERDTIKEALKGMQAQMKKVEGEDSERKWISEGLANFGDLLRRNNDTLEKLTDKVTAALVKYTNSMVGGIYLLNEEEEQPLLELMAFYAMDIKKYNKKNYRPGEGLVGQTFLEEDYIYLLEVPEDYISITSGIGETSPKAILLVPLKVEEEVFGVIELASLKEYKAYEVSFVRKLSEIISSTIQNVKINQRTKKLLEESQEMTEQMRSQEEEMRQNMEELSATQEEMGRKEQEITSRLEAINNTLALAEYNADKRITHVNKNFATLFQLSVEDLMGKSQQTLLPESEADYNGFLDLWSALKKGEVKSGVFKRRISDDQIIDIEATYTPVKNSKGEIIKVIEFAEEVRQQEMVVAGESKYAVEVEQQLRDNLEALEITNRTLSAKAQNIAGAQVNIIAVAEVDRQGVVKNGGEELEKIFDRQIFSVLELESLNTDIFLHEQTSGELTGASYQLKYFIRRLGNDRFLFLLMKN